MCIHMLILFANDSYFLGKRAADEGRPARYGTIDFCKDPSAICNRSEHPELKWIAGMFYWMSSLQPYDNEWNYMDNLKEFVRGGMQDGGAFIDAVSGIVNRGCHNPPCGTGILDGGQERKENFKSKSFVIRSSACVVLSFECLHTVSL